MTSIVTYSTVWNLVIRSESSCSHLLPSPEASTSDPQLSGEEETTLITPRNMFSVSHPASLLCWRATTRSIEVTGQEEGDRDYQRKENTAGIKEKSGVT